MLARLFEVPRTPEDWLRFSMDHLDSHNRIREAIQAKGGANLPAYPIDPITKRTFGDFLQYNAQMHSDMNGSLGLQGADLLSVNFDEEGQRIAWIDIHSREHQMAEQTLGV